MEQLCNYVCGNSHLFVREIDDRFVYVDLKVILSDDFIDNAISNYNQFHESTNKEVVPFSYYDMALVINYLIAMNVEESECILKSHWCMFVENALSFIEETTFVENEPLTKKILTREI